MQIKTAVTLITGAAVGFLFGCCVPNEAKEREIDRIKKKLIFLMTGEKWEHKKKPVYTGTYKRYTDYRVPKTKAYTSWNDIREDVLYFKRYDEAEKFIGQIEKFFEEHPYMSVHDLCTMRGKSIDYTWDHYVWSREDILLLDKKPLFEENEFEFYVHLPEPKIIE